MAQQKLFDRTFGHFFVSKGLPRTPAGALAALWRYETNNADLDSRTLRMMALAAITPRFTRKVVSKALGGQHIPWAFQRDRSWFYWNVLVLSHLDQHWETFKELAQSKNMRTAALWLRDHVPAEHYALFLRRSGHNPMNLARHSKALKARLIWTKAGTWSIGPFSKLLILHQHLPERQLVLPYQRKLGHAGVQLIERELFTLLDPDAIFPHIARERAVRWAIMRMHDLTDYRVGPKAAAWFFQTVIPDKHFQVWAPDAKNKWHVRKFHVKSFERSRPRWEW